MSASDRATPWIGVASVLALVGGVVALWRPAGLPPVVPTPLAQFGPEVLEAVHAYQRPRTVGRGIATLVEVAVPLAVVLTPWGRRWVGRLAGSREAWWRGGLVAAGIAVALSLVRLPLAVWLGYVHDTRWGFNTAGPVAWARDWLLSGAVGWVVAGIGGAVLAGAVRRWPTSWHWRLVGVGTLLTALLVLAHPLVVEPLFYRTTPLPPGPAREQVRRVLEAAGEPDVPILVGDASRRTTRVNAFVSGLGPTRRVVLFDTLLTRPPEQIGVVVAHELAHREHHDLARSVLLSAAGLLVGLQVVRRLWDSPAARRWVAARGRDDPRLVAVAVAGAVVVQLVLQPVAMAASRRAEAAADARALALTGEPSALVRVARGFTVRDLADPAPPRALHLLWGTHPTVRNRIRMAAGFAAFRDLDLPDPAAVRRAERDLLHPAVGR